MRRFVFMLICVAVLTLTSCAGNQGSFFDYQGGELSYDCALIYNGNENQVSLYLSAPNGDGARETVTVEYRTPSMIGGYVLEKSNGAYRGRMGSLEIPFGEKNAGVVEKLEAAFSLSQDMICDIEVEKGDVTVATVESSGLSGRVATDSEGRPLKIELSFSDGDSLTVQIQ